MNPFMSAIRRGAAQVFSATVGEIGVLTLESGDQVRMHVIYQPRVEIVEVRDDVERTVEVTQVSFRKDQLEFAGVTDEDLYGATITLELSGETYGLDNISDDEIALITATVTSV